MFSHIHLSSWYVQNTVESPLDEANEPFSAANRAFTRASFKCSRSVSAFSSGDPSEPSATVARAFRFRSVATEGIRDFDGTILRECERLLVTFDICLGNFDTQYGTINFAIWNILSFVD